MTNLIETLESEMTKDHVTAVNPGDTVEVHYLIREGDKERVQVFIGTVIAILIAKAVTGLRVAPEVEQEGLDLGVTTNRRQNQRKLQHDQSVPMYRLQVKR